MWLTLAGNRMSKWVTGEIVGNSSFSWPDCLLLEIHPWVSLNISENNVIIEGDRVRKE